MSSQLVVEKEEQAKPAAPATARQIPLAASAVPDATQRVLFSQSFVEMSEQDRKRRRWTTGTTFIIQSVIMTILVIVPLMVIDALPTAQLAAFLTAPPPPPPPPPPPAPSLKVVRVVSEVMNGQLLAPSKIPQAIKMIKEEEAPASTGGVLGGVEGGVPGGQAGGVLGSILSVSNHSTAPTVATPKRLRVSSGISEGMLTHRVEPTYPTIALRAHIQGQVLLSAIISKEGAIENLKLISGHPMLVPAAIEAVKQWHYRPYILNGEGLEVETTVTVNFYIGRTN
jgi:protein TonB